jgi:hypothetical protein
MCTRYERKISKGNTTPLHHQRLISQSFQQVERLKPPDLNIQNSPFCRCGEFANVVDEPFLPLNPYAPSLHTSPLHLSKKLKRISPHGPQQPIQPEDLHESHRYQHTRLDLLLDYPDKPAYPALQTSPPYI